ncbi:MAG TPA: hypothetical protein QGH10_04015 [Armatimonadota bacterium]|nr:hypothetical protein [Armatimonadota bacterium]
MTDLATEASLHAVLAEHGYPAAPALWVDDGHLLVTEWVDGPSLTQLSDEPPSEERLRRIGRCIEGLIHLEEAEPVFRQHIADDQASTPGASAMAADVCSGVRTLIDDDAAESVVGLLRELAEFICAEPSSPGISDIWPGEIILGASGPVFLDIGVLAHRWPEWRFCQYFARGQRTQADRSDQGRRLLQLLPRLDASRLDAHYLLHDVSYMRAWHDLAAEFGAPRDPRNGRTPTSVLSAACQRLTWPGACAAANEVRQRLQQGGLTQSYPGADRD